VNPRVEAARRYIEVAGLPVDPGPAPVAREGDWGPPSGNEGGPDEEEGRDDAWPR